MKNTKHIFTPKFQGSMACNICGQAKEARDHIICSFLNTVANNLKTGQPGADTTGPDGASPSLEPHSQ